MVNTPHRENNATPTGGSTAEKPCSYRVINVAVPEEVYWHIRQCATKSKMSMKDFMARFCREARHYRSGRVRKKVLEHREGGAR
jgi:hypothetical protein